jgi:hypothetical protein
MVMPFIALILLVLLIVFVKNWDDWKRERSQRARKKARVMMVTMIVIIASITSLYTWVDLHRYRYNYIASVNAGNLSGVVYLPVSTNEELQDEIGLVSGDGRLSIEDTEYGRALRIEFSGSVKVEGRIVKSNHLDDWELTMCNDTRRCRNIWVYLELNGGMNGSVDIGVGVEKVVVPGHDEGYDLRTPLVEGWNTYRLTAYTE